MIPGPGWYDDPWVRGGLRYWDGISWTSYAAVPQRPAVVPKPPHPTLPLSVALASLAAVLIPIVLSKVVVYHLGGLGWPIPALVAVSAVVGYLPGLLYWRWVAQTYGQGDLRATVGLYARRGDWGIGPLTWIASMAARVAVAVVITILQIPITGNLEAPAEGEVNRAAVIAVLITAVVVAPIVEEIIFRGLLLRGLLSRMTWIPAVLVQGVLFGMAHFDPEFGVGNIGLIMVLASAGVVLGGATYLQRRLAPAIIAHAMMNALAMIVVLAR